METGMESEDSDIEILSVNINEDDSDIDSPKSVHVGEPTSIGPVLSLACLYEDDEVTPAPEDNAVILDAMDAAESSGSASNSVLSDELQDPTSSEDSSDESDSIDIDEIPELIVKCAEENTQEAESTRIDSGIKDNNVVIAEMPDIIMKSVEDNFHHPNHAPASGIPKHLSSKNYKYVSKLTHLSVPARNVFEGKHKFKIQFSCQIDSRFELYCERKNKLYVAKDHPVKVLVHAEGAPSGSEIKVCAVFSCLEHSNEVLQRCPTHLHQDLVKGVLTYEHVVLSLGNTAVYENNDNVLSVKVPYEEPHDGETFTSYLYKLTCFSSCTGGINRRPFMLIFTLEKDDIVLGRQIVDVKVSASPLRDYQVEMKKEIPRTLNTNSPITAQKRSVLLKEISTSNSTEKPSLPKENYLITVKDPELFQFLRHMKALYDAGAMAEKLQSELFDESI